MSGMDQCVHRAEVRTVINGKRVTKERGVSLLLSADFAKYFAQPMHISVASEGLFALSLSQQQQASIDEIAVTLRKRIMDEPGPAEERILRVKQEDVAEEVQCAMSISPN